MNSQIGAIPSQSMVNSEVCILSGSLHFLQVLSLGGQCLLNSKVLPCFSEVIMSRISFSLFRVNLQGP